jgi:hypothetical protein
MKTNLFFTNRLFRLFSLLAAIALFSQCEGPMGPRGQDGIDGADANAYSVIYTVEPNDWTGDANGYVASLPMAEIDNYVYENGAVLVYWLNEEPPKNFTILPYSYLNSEGLTTVMAYDAFIGNIRLFYQEIFEGYADTWAPEYTWAFKVVVVEGIPLATLKSTVDITDYKAVESMLKID